MKTNWVLLRLLDIFKTAAQSKKMTHQQAVECNSLYKELEPVEDDISELFYQTEGKGNEH